MSYSHGIHGRLTRGQQNQRNLQIRRQNRRIERKYEVSESSGPVNPFDLTKPYPALLAILKNVPMSYLMNAELSKKGIKAQDEYFRTAQQLFKPSEFSKSFPFQLPNVFANYFMTLRAWVKMEIKVRTRIRRLVQLWLAKKYKSRMLNTEDPCTMSAPIKPVYIFDPASRGTYVFEATSLKQHMESSLGYARWMIPEPKMPTNPFTNLPFSIGQLLVLQTAMRFQNVSSWMLEGFQDSKYDLKLFEVTFARPLRINALKVLHRNPTSEDLIDELRDFVEDNYEEEKINKPAHLTAICWGVEFKPLSDYIGQWRQVWYDYMYPRILHGTDYFESHLAEHRKIMVRLRGLFKKDSEIQNLAEERLAAINPRLERHPVVWVHNPALSNFMVNNPMIRITANTVNVVLDESIEALVEHLLHLQDGHEETETLAAEEDTDSDSGLP
jgi:hypothetical protein